MSREVTSCGGFNQNISFNRDPPDLAFRPTMQLSAECIFASSKSPVGDDSDDGGGENRGRNCDEIRDLGNQSSDSTKGRSNTSDIPDEVNSDDEIGAWIYERSRAAKARADESLSAAIETKSAINGVTKSQKAKGKKQNQTQLIVPKRTIPAETDNRVAPPKRSRKACSHKGSSGQFVRGGVCVRHGAKRKTCSHDGCTNQVQRGGVCVRHGAKRKRKKCSHDGCTNQVQCGGVCVRHGAKRKKYGEKRKRRKCSHEECSNWIVRGGVCVRHGAKRKKCNHDGCTSWVVCGGVCVRHGGKHKECSHEGCTNQVQRGGVCGRHGGKPKECSHDGCTNQARSGVVCVRHGVKRRSVERGVIMR